MEDKFPVKYAEYEQESFNDAVTLFHALADNAPSLIWISGPDKLCNYFNKRWLEFTGRTLEQEIGMGWTEGIHPDDLRPYVDNYEANFTSRVEFQVKYRLRRHDGQYRWVLDNGSPLYLPDGTFAGYIGSCMDVTESVAEISSLEYQNYLIKSITDNVTVGLFLMDSQNRCTFMNPAAESMTGYTVEEIRGKPLHDVLHHTHMDGAPFSQDDCPIDLALGKMQSVKDHETHYIRKTGQFFPVAASSNPIINDGRVIGMVLEVRDLSLQKNSEAMLKRNDERFRALIEKSSDVVALIDMNADILYVSPSVKRVLGYSTDEFSQRNGFDYVHTADLNYTMDEFAKVMQSPGESISIETRVRHVDGSWRWVEAVCTNLIHDPNIGAVVLNFRDTTERKAAEDKAKYQYYHDSLTGLPNRNYFIEQLNDLVVPDRQKLFGVMIIDLDRFKMINESLGHAVGDMLIQDVSLRLNDCLEDTDVLARLGGDEYGIVLKNIIREEEIGQVCSKILDCLKPAFRYENQELYITPSIGITVFPYDGTDVSSLLKNADSALYRAKEIGRNNFQYYNPSMNATTFQQLAMENTLRRALENEEFLVYYQPQIDVATGRIVQVEALIRWMHPELGLTFPDEFIPIAETTGLIQPIGEWVLKTACKEVKRWEEFGHKVGLAVNLSVRQLRQKHLIRNVRKILSETGFDPKRLELEITENVLVDNSSAVYNTLVQLKKDGITFAIDDFNTGYSSLNYLKRFPIDILKLDKTFVKGIPMKDKDSAIANAIINLTRSLGMTVVAEGVERLDQLKFLKERNCDKAQGYLFSPPISGEDLVQLLNKNSVWMA
jgi:diguanylate cyclase (GGDEF)-like protein/PAS domain S-box-containing protein